MVKKISRLLLKRSFKYLIFLFLLLGFSVFVLIQFTDRNISYTIIDNKPIINENIKSSTQIIIITPTYKRYTRIADITRMANTLRLVPNIFWILIEDGVEKSKLMERLLDRSQIPYKYLVHKTAEGYPKRGWYQRDMALTFLRKYHHLITKNYTHSVVFFGDDDNSYDTRLFTDYIANVKNVGIWAVGHVGGAVFESPKVENGKVIGWHVKWNPGRKFATDMAGFAISLKRFIDYPEALFGKSCKRGGGAPEPCLLEDLGITREILEPFGFDNPPGISREILVYHTKTTKPKGFPKQDLYGYDIELM